VKIVSKSGHCLELAWEPLAEKLINAPDLRTFLEEFDNSPDKITYGFKGESSIFTPSCNEISCFAIDTRESGPILQAAAINACKIMGVKTVNYGVCTTPQHAWLVS